MSTPAKRRTPAPPGIRLPPGVPTMPVAALRKADVNPRLHTPAQIERLATAIRAFGFLVPVVVADDGLLAGHARLEAAHLLGLAEVPYVNAEHLTPAERRAYLIADNQLALDSAWDEGVLARELADLADALGEGFDRGALGFEPEALDRWLARAAATDAPDAFTEVDPAQVETSYRCPVCHYEWSGSPRPGRGGEKDAAPETEAEA